MSKSAVFALLFLPFVCSSASAAAPDEVLRQIMTKIKKQQDFSPIVDYVRWEEAFAGLSDVQRQQLRVSDAEEMREFYRELLGDPQQKRKSQIESQMASATPENRERLERTLAQEQDKLARQQQEMSERIAGTIYEVGTPQVTGNTAIVPLRQKYQGKTVESQVKFIRVGDTWLLPSVTALRPVDKGPERAKE